VPSQYRFKKSCRRLSPVTEMAHDSVE